MIDEKKLIEELKESGMVADNEYGNAMVDMINNQPKIGGWIPCSEAKGQRSGQVAYKGESMKKEWVEAQRIKDFKERMPDVFSENLIRYMVIGGFFTCPSSARHHGAFEGGNFWHSRMVAMLLREYTEKMGLEWERPESPEVIGWLHDLCKMDEYIKLADDEGGCRYEKIQSTSITGHGIKSAVIAGLNMRLTEEEIHCIIWHMGAFTGESRWGSYSTAVKKYPNILWVHHADMMASNVKGI